MLKLYATPGEVKQLTKLLNHFRDVYGLPAGQIIYLAILNRSRTAIQ